MPEDAKSGSETPDRRAGDDRRSGGDRRQSRRGIRNLAPFSWFLDRRRSGDRRRGGDRRESGAADERDPGYVKATELTTEPIRLQELSTKSGIPLDRLRQAAFGKVELSAEERALLPGWGRGEDG